MKVLFVHSSLQTFVEKDLSILREEHQVRELQFTSKEKLFFNVLPNLRELAQGVIWCDITFSWFGKLHAFFAVLFSKILGKRAVVIAGGDDVANMPEIKYGMFAHFWKKWCPLFVFRYADLILAVSDFNRRNVLNNAGANPKKVSLICHGFDAGRFKQEPEWKREDMVVTVGRVTQETVSVKGLELFVRSARYLPDVPFMLVGPWGDDSIEYLKNIATQNVRFTGAIYGQDLAQIYNQAKVYVQASIHESFGCSLAEAMLCGCIPVVSRKAALPQVVGNCGIYIDRFEPEEVAQKISEALRSSTRFSRKARERIKTFFPLEKRRRKLLKAVAEL